MNERIAPAEIRKCLNIGDVNRYGIQKEYTCLELPPEFIHKRIDQWMCGNCALQLLDNKLGKIIRIEVV